jgi:signal transduction histidine kinase
MIRRAIRGLRGRLLLALVFTSAVTLAVAAVVALRPLQSQLRDQSVKNLESTVDATVSQQLEPEVRKGQRQSWDFTSPGYDLSNRTDARVVVFGPIPSERPLFNSGSRDPDDQSVLVGLRSWRLGETVVDIDGDNLAIGMPLYRKSDVKAVVVVQRRLSEVTTALDQVRNALLAAGGIGLAVAVALGLALSSTLTRRLGRLRRAALRITRDGPDAPTLRDLGRDEVGDLARALGRMQEELRRQESARRSFVSTASHELRTPLTMLQGTMELLDEDLRDGVDMDDAREQVANARRELRRLSTLASELLDLSRLDADVQLRSEPVELSEIARAVVAEFGVRAAERHVGLEAVTPSDPCWARADPAACARVVRILIDNALRYAPAGEPVLVTTAHEGGKVTVDVADRGAGVPDEEREHIFERFHRGKASSAEIGFGLGLAIGRELAERMSGSLTLADADTGARFRLTLPASSASSRTRSPAPGSAAAV